MTFTFKQATPKDANTIASLHTKSWQTAYKNSLSDDYLNNHALKDRQAVWQKRFETENPNQFVSIAKEYDYDDCLAGFVCVFANFDEQFGAMLDNLHVDKAFQGKGLGKSLIKQAALWLRDSKQANSSSMFLWVFETNHSARKLYEGLGAINHEVSNELMPDGNRISAVRYVWKDIDALCQILQNNP